MYFIPLADGIVADEITKVSMDIPEDTLQVPTETTELDDKEEITEQPIKSVHEIAMEICTANSWGTGETRVANLIAAGYNPVEVQTEVNAIMETILAKYQKIETITTVDYTSHEICSLVWNTLTALGYSETVTAGIMGNMAQECGLFNSRWALGYSGRYYGLCMWSVKYHGKLFELYGTYPSIQNQCEYLAMTFTALKQDCSVDYATTYFFNHYEKAGDSTLNKRIRYAWSIYNEFHS